jgi:hypothetical protein
MKYWLLYSATRVVLLLLLLGTALFAIRYPALWASADHIARWGMTSMGLLTATRILAPVLLAFGWFAHFMAMHRLGRPS